MSLLKLCVLFFLIAKCDSLTLDDYCTFKSGNTPCYYKCERSSRCGITKGGFQVFTDEERNAALATHNECRGKVAEGTYASKGLPAASNMMVMSYDKECEFLAGCYIKQCLFDHDSVRMSASGESMGQNLYMSTTTVSVPMDNVFIAAGIMAWFKEVDLISGKSEGAGYLKNFEMNYNTGHFTQMVWKSTKYVGCAKMHSIQSSGWNTYYLFCDYMPAGNMQGDKMYSTGDITGTKNDQYASLTGKIRPLEEDTYIPPIDLNSTFTFGPKIQIIFLLSIILFYYWTM